MNSLQFNRTGGNVPKTLSGKDHTSGFIYYLPSEEIPASFVGTPIALVSTLEQAEGLGITSLSTAWNLKNLHYQLSQTYRLNPGITLYVGLFASPTEAYTFSEVKQLQNYAGGDLRQIAIWNGSHELTPSDLTALQGVATELEAEDVPLSLLYAPKVGAPATLPTTLYGEGKKNISVVIGQDGEGVAKTLHHDASRCESTVSGVGVVLGLVSAAAVHESIAWVQKYPTGVALPAFGDGTLYRSLDKGIIEALDNSRYLFFTTYSGLSGSYLNDSHNMDSPSGDYCTIELVRTMDKAIRGIRTYLLPELGSPLYVDPDTGRMNAETVAHLETVANYQLEDMRKAGELSGYLVEIDPQQNVLASSTIEFVIRGVAVGVLRKGIVKIGYTLSV